MLNNKCGIAKEKQRKNSSASKLTNITLVKYLEMVSDGFTT
jgi:hypothetical protein